MFERFTDSSRRLLTLAHEEVVDLDHTVIGNVHLLLALMREGEAGASKILSKLGITVERAREVASGLHESAEVRPVGHVPFTREAKRALELALRAALRRGHNFIGTAHVLEGILDTNDPTVARFLGELGLEMDEARGIAGEAAGAYGARAFDEVTRFRAAAHVRGVLENLTVSLRPKLAADEIKSLLERLAGVEDARVEEAKARAAAEARVESLRRQLDEARAEIDNLRRRASGE